MLKATSDPASSTEASIASTFTLQRVIVSCHATSQSDIVSRLTKKTEDITAHPKKLRISGQWISATPKAPALNLPFLTDTAFRGHL